MKRFLTQREAERCEMAQEPACKCRCGGEKHGAGRVGKGGDFSMLPMDDPHYRPALTKNQAIRMLKNVLNLHLRFSRYYDRDTFVKEHGWDAWVKQDTNDWNAFWEAQQILLDAIVRVRHS